mgnify:CR=1 FL=1
MSCFVLSAWLFPLAEIMLYLLQNFLEDKQVIRPGIGIHDLITQQIKGMGEDSSLRNIGFLSSTTCWLP